MERFDMFNLIHKGLRASLYQTALKLQQTDFTVEEETEEALNRVKEVVMLFDGHAGKEDKFVLPAIEAYEPSVVAGFEEEHIIDEELGKQLTAWIEKVQEAQGISERIKTGKELTASFVSFMVFNLQHMAKEEDIINKILWRYYSDEELQAISSQISQSVAPWILEFYFGWMLRGINNREASYWLKAVRNNMPPIVLESILQKARQVLPKQRYLSIAGSISDAVPSLS